MDNKWRKSLFVGSKGKDKDKDKDKEIVVTHSIGHMRRAPARSSGDPDIIKAIENMGKDTHADTDGR